MECAGNARGASFGLISVANWEGVPISRMLDRVGFNDRRARILISGFDTYASLSRTSIPGASWNFSADDLSNSTAFLATKMNGSKLTLDHGAPVRLVVPRWYGCCCIKWVNEITRVGVDVAATSQMQEYASRTDQNGKPDLAREYEPAMIDPAAIPIRIERWKVSKRIQYKIFGIYWGGAQPVKSLKISFNGGAGWHPVDRIYERTADSWALWTHAWSPKSPGKYRIRLKVDDPLVRTRRLDKGYYDREIDILTD
jgi:DMSO/TMAO reductase YedYZ molybdopterin-dependent catalytic subunit